MVDTLLLNQTDGIANTISLGFIDDEAFATARPTTTEVCDQLQVLVHRELRWGSKFGAAFNKEKSQWMIMSHKPAPTPLPTLQLGAFELSPQPLIKWLGVLIDPKLTFTARVRAQVGKGTRVANRLACLAKTGWGIPSKQCLQLTSALIHSRVDYAGMVWHRYGKHTGPPSKLQRIDHIAYRFLLGVFRTHPTLFLLHDTCSATAGHRLDAKTDTAIIRLLSMPDSNPAAKLL